MKTVLVTGACGFIGSHFVRALQGHTTYRVVNLDKLTYAGDLARLDDLNDHDRYRFVRGDIADPEVVDTVFQQEAPWAVVNFAAETHVDRSILDSAPFLKTNVDGLQVLLEAARRNGVARFVQISTDEVYGDLSDGDRSSEEAPLRPSSPYAASKAAADLLCLAYRRTYGVPSLLARSSNNYGPWQFPEKLIPLMIGNAIGGRMLPVYGDGSQRRDWLHVTDNCRAILLLLERGEAGAVYNIAATEQRTNLEVIRAVCAMLVDQGVLSAQQALMRIRFVADRPGHDKRYDMDTSRIRGELGWFPRIRFDEGIRHTVLWYLEHREWIGRTTQGDFADYYEAVYANNWGRGS